MKSKNYVIKVAGVTKNYGENRGNFNISLNIEKGKTLGVVGVNGAGKTTLLRQLMGFIKSDSGSCTINGCDC
jgi:ABC-2 type transport system ATP-binding protein